MKFNYTLVVFLFLSLAAGCDRIICTRKGLASQHLGAGYYFENTECRAPAIYDSTKGGTFVIDCCVLDLAYDSTFIIVCQHPYDDTTIVDRHYMSLSERDEAFARSTYRQYWIIDKLGPRNRIIIDNDLENSNYANVYGPYQKEEFRKRRKELGVPDSLKLRPAIPRDA